MQGGDVVTLLLMLIETGNLISSSFYKNLSQRVSSLSWQLPKKARIKVTDVDEDYATVEELNRSYPVPPMITSSPLSP